MQPPLPNGTVLQNRYRLLGVLGQGGFGRTYLAEDQGRFNERCALKEFIPLVGSDQMLQKSKELFQREAAVLYQINHPQVPQFRATFEDDQRLYLVQDYVEGKTFRQLIEDRQAQGTVFSEAEVVQLMRQLLPVLAHIHSKGIVHRDISPENIILRQSDQLPVLIDFGVVKEMATRVQVTTLPQYTTVGKMGYAPGEQMQTGQAYPNSDLYALAVTAVVLLTGREPRDLYDDRALTWHWQNWARVSPGFAAILNRMLSYRPGDRYQSAAEVINAFQGLGTSYPTQAVGNPPIAPYAAGSPAPGSNPDLSTMPTMAVGRQYDPRAAVTPPSYSPPPAAPSPTPQRDDSLWDKPWAVFLMCLGLAIVTGITSWAVWNAILNGTSEPTPTPTETPTPTPTPTTPTPTPEPEPVEYSQVLTLEPDTPLSLDGNLQANETINYIISATAGQTLRANLTEETVLLSVFGPDGDFVNNRAQRVRAWEGILETDGDYVVQIQPVRGVSDSDYTLNLELQSVPEPEPTPTEEPTPTPTETAEPDPEVVSEVISFPPGSTGVQVSARIDPSIVRQYLLQAQAGQIMSVEVTRGNARITVIRPSGSPISGSSGVVFWQGTLDESGNFVVEVVSDRPGPFSLDIGIVDVE
jgi:serine/threonine protein kinase